MIGTYSVGQYPQGLAFDGTNIWVAIANGHDSSVAKLLANTGVVLRNVGHKTITSYTFACFVLDGKKRKIDVVFDEPERGTIPPNETTGGYGFDATPPNMCRHRKALLGVYQVQFSDSTSWSTTASR